MDAVRERAARDPHGEEAGPESTGEQILTGVFVGESKSSVDIANGEGKIQSVPREDIDELTASTKSLMPDGFEKQVSAEGFANLLEFLSQRPK